MRYFNDSVIFLSCVLLMGCTSTQGRSLIGLSGIEPSDSPWVLQFHKNASRDGNYIDAKFTRSAISRGSKIRQLFASPVPGPVYAQPLYFHNASSGKNLVIVASEQNLVTALDSVTGEMIWRQNLGTPVPLKSLQCGNINPLGITGTPVIDAGSKTLFVNAMTTPDEGKTKKHLIYALSTETGAIRPGWPVDVEAVLKTKGMVFHSEFQNQRGALAFLSGKVYVPYGGHYGDCGDYRGWVVGVSGSDPRQMEAWSTSAQLGGIWAPGGISSDSASLFVTTGNTQGATTWGGGEGVIRLDPGPSFSGKTKDFFAPSDWKTLDEDDMDLGGMAPVLFDLPGSHPEHLIFTVGKTGVAYLINRDDLGGIGGSLATQPVTSPIVISSPTVYSNENSTFIVFKASAQGCPTGQSGDLMALKAVPGAPPSLATGWCAKQNGRGSPIVTTPDGKSDFVVWSLGSEGDNKLHAFDGESGKALYESASLGLIRRFQTPIAAQGKVYVAADQKVYAFQLQ